MLHQRSGCLHPVSSPETSTSFRVQEAGLQAGLLMTLKRSFQSKVHPLMPQIDIDPCGTCKLCRAIIHMISHQSPHHLNQAKSTIQSVFLAGWHKGQNPGTSFSRAFICAQFSQLIISHNTLEHGFQKITQTLNYFCCCFPFIDTRQSMYLYHYKGKIYRRQKYTDFQPTIIK